MAKLPYETGEPMFSGGSPGCGAQRPRGSRKGLLVQEAISVALVMLVVVDAVLVAHGGGPRGPSSDR